MIQEFGLSITAVGDDQYWVRTEKVARGVQLAEEKMEWPVASWIEQTKLLMHDPLLGLLKGQLPRLIVARSDDELPFAQADPNLATLVHLGQTLHNQLFKGQLRDSWVTAQGVAQNRQALLRLRIGIKDNRLQQLPWEALHAGNRPLTAGTDVIFSRYILNRHQLHSASLVRPSTGTQVLRILMVIATPNDQERLELKQEVHQLQAELHPHLADTGDSSVDIQLKILEQPGRAELTQALERGDYQVLHYAGHSSTGNDGSDLYLVSHQTGLSERLSGEDLAGLLVNNGVKLAVFNSCRGSYSADFDESSWQKRNLAQALIIRGVPAVIAMTERIPDHVAITFTQLLYRNLKKGQAIDLSLNRTRQGLISAYGSHQFYWVLPTLYMHPLFDGYLVARGDSLEDAHLLDAVDAPFDDIFPESKTAQKGRSSLSNLKVSASEPKKVATTMRFDSCDDPVDATDTADTDTLVNAQSNVTNGSDALSDETVVRETSAATVPEHEETRGETYDGSPVSANSRNQANSYSDDSYDQSKADLSVMAPRDTAADLSELVGERRARSHTLHTKILTRPGAIAIALVALFSLTAVTWLQRDRTRIAPANSVDELSLPTQVDIALSQNDLDEVTVAMKALIDEGRFSEAIAALQSASQVQQQDAVIAFLKGRSHWGLVKQNDGNHSPEDAMRAWKTALESESDWMEIVMALGFAQHALGLNQPALESWQRAVSLAEKQATAKGAYFSNKTFGEYALNAYAGIAITSLSLSEIEIDAAQKQQLLEQSVSAYQQVISQAPADFDAKMLTANWLWLDAAITDWETTRTTLDQTIQIK